MGICSFLYCTIFNCVDIWGISVWKSHGVLAGQSHPAYMKTKRSFPKLCTRCLRYHHCLKEALCFISVHEFEPSIVYIIATVKERILTGPQLFYRLSIVPSLRVLFYLSIALYATHGHPQSFSTAIPPSLASAVPVCARLCLQLFIVESFPSAVCPSQQELDCLCTRKSSTGYTLGEGALRCVASACTNETVPDAGVYAVCAGIQNALPNTHATITATMVAAGPATADSNIFDTNGQTTSSQAPSSSTFPPVINAPGGSVSLTGLVTASGQPPNLTSPTSTPSLTPSTSVPSHTSQAAAAAATTSTAPAQTGTLTGPQIAGIAVAGVVSASVAFGIMLFVYCLRRRRALKHQSEQLPFEIEKAPPKASPQPPAPPPPPPKDIKGGDGDNDNGTRTADVAPKVPPKVPPKDTAKRRSFWRRTIKPDDIGVAVSPETARQTSPKSVASYRTTSRLLPTKPAYTLWPPASRMIQYARPESTATDFEEDLDGGRRSGMGVPSQASRGRNFIDTSQSPVQQRYTRKQCYPQQSIMDPRALMYAKERDQNLRRPSLPADIRPETERSQEGQWAVSPDQIRRPPALRHPTSLTPAPAHTRKVAHLTATPPTARSSNYSGNLSLAASEPGTSSHTQSYHPAFRKSTGKQSVRYSSASDTSFESAGDDDESPPAEPALSPVAESPQRSPISALKYPRVPNSASIAKKAGIYQPQIEGAKPDGDHRTGKIVDLAQPKASKKRDDSPSSLLAKRRGDQAAAELEKGLRLREDGNAVPKVNPKWKAVNSPGIENAGQGLKSPVWEPKLTPTMRGGDLYLDVQ